MIKDITSEERLAWDLYVAGILAGSENASCHDAALDADEMLSERRKRFDLSPQPPKPPMDLPEPVRSSG